MTLTSYAQYVIIFDVPRIEVLEGDVVITINFRDHLPPHVHVRASGEVVLLVIDTGEILRGAIAKAQLKRARAYVLANGEMLRAEWARIQAEGKGQV